MAIANFNPFIIHKFKGENDDGTVLATFGYRMIPFNVQKAPFYFEPTLYFHYQ